MGECADAGVKGAIVLAAGFKETGPAGIELEFQVLEQARRGRIRLIGPNCLGVMRPHGRAQRHFCIGSMAAAGERRIHQPDPGRSGPRRSWIGASRPSVGFSAFVSIGSMLDVGWGDLIDYLGDDPETRSIVIYMESVGDARSFLSAAREVALTKPIIVIKAGRTEPRPGPPPRTPGPRPAPTRYSTPPSGAGGSSGPTPSPTSSPWPRSSPSSPGRGGRG